MYRITQGRSAGERTGQTLEKVLNCKANWDLYRSVRPCLVSISLPQESTLES